MALKKLRSKKKKRVVRSAPPKARVTSKAVGNDGVEPKTPRSSFFHTVEDEHHLLIHTVQEPSVPEDAAPGSSFFTKPEDEHQVLLQSMG